MSAGRARLPGERDPELQSLLAGMLESGDAAAAVALAGNTAGIDRLAVAGRTRADDGRRLRGSELFDLASLTKPFTASLALALDRIGALPLDTGVGELWGAAAAPRLADRTLEALLRHRAGLRAWAPLYRRAKTRAGALRFLLSGDALDTRRERYGDLGYVLWALSAERALGASYGSLLRRHLLEPLGLRRVRGSPEDRAVVVESRLDNRREVELAAAQGIAVARIRGPRAGAAQDGNARFMGGLSGHAGLFGAAEDLWRLAAEWLAPDRVLTTASVRGALAGGRRFALGWARRTVRGSAGPYLSPDSFGHVGFTGGSLWIDPSRDAIMVLLAHRTSVEADLAPWRRRFHRIILDP